METFDAIRTALAVRHFKDTPHLISRMKLQNGTNCSRHHQQAIDPPSRMLVSAL
jgi:hypothetical protein